MTSPQDPPGPDATGTPWGAPVPPPAATPAGSGGPGYGGPGSGGPGYGGPGYGAPPPGYGYPPGGQPWPGASPANGFGVTALVTGIVTAVFGVVPGLNFLALPVGVVALVFGFLARGKAKRREATNGGQALAGIICAAVGLAASVLWIVAFVGLSSSSTECHSFHYGNDTSYNGC